MGLILINETAAPLRAKPLEQAREHSLYLDQFSLGTAMFANLDHVQVPGEQKKVLEFAGRSHRHVQELAEFGAPSSAATLRNVCGNRTGGPSDLTAEPKALFNRELTRNSINLKNKLMAAAPNLQLPEVLHLALPFHRASDAGNYLQLNTNNGQLELRGVHAI